MNNIKLELVDLETLSTDFESQEELYGEDEHPHISHMVLKAIQESNFRKIKFSPNESHT